MAREFILQAPIMAHDDIEVDVDTFLGGKPRNPETPSRPGDLSLKERLQGFAVIFVGEIPHSNIDSALDLAIRPETSMVDRIRSVLPFRRPKS